MGGYRGILGLVYWDTGFRGWLCDGVLVIGVLGLYHWAILAL